MIDDRARRRSRIRWLCRRGMKELDVLLERFCRSELARLDDADLSHLETLLRHEDPDLYTVLVGGARLADPGRDRLAARIRDHRRVV